jgi:hypothetical protein
MVSVINNTVTTPANTLQIQEVSWILFRNAGRLESTVTVRYLSNDTYYRDGTAVNTNNPVEPDANVISTIDNYQIESITGSFTLADSSGIPHTDAVTGLSTFHNATNILHDLSYGSGYEILLDQGGLSFSVGSVDYNFASDDKHYPWFALTSSSTGQESLTFRAFVTPVCYCAGTRLAAARGSVPVETLRVGDLVKTRSGLHRPIRWIGHRTIDCRSEPVPEEVWPVRIAAGAFGEGQPERDLLVSPGHGICVDLDDEVLIPALALVNGATVVQQPVDTVEYWHVELDSHDLLLAEGLLAESYVDTGNRGFFATGEGRIDPDRSAASHADFCRPFHDDGAMVAQARALLHAQALESGWTIAADPGEMHIVADGAQIEPVIDGLVMRFMVPAATQDAWLVSEAARPWDIGNGADRRVLGVSIRTLTINDGLSVCRIVDASDPRLDDGAHACESDAQGGFSRRWTKGRMRLPSALWAGCRDVFFLRVECADPVQPHWRAPAARAATVGPSLTQAVKRVCFEKPSSTALLSCVPDVVRAQLPRSDLGPARRRPIYRPEPQTYPSER